MALPYKLTKTLIAALTEMQAIAKVTPRFFTNSTLNYKYGVNPDTLPVEAPKIAYFGMGIRGMKNLDDNLSAPYVPLSSNMDLFEPIPFRVVPADADLDPIERSNYRIRVLRQIEGQDYFCYYLKKLVILDNAVKILDTEIATGNEVEIDEFDPNNLTPTPFHTTAEGNITAEHELSVALDTELHLTGEEVVESINILYAGNLLKARISELAIYSGEDADVAGPDGVGGTLTYTEAMYAQMLYHYTSIGDNFSDVTREEHVKVRINSASAFIL